MARAGAFPLASQPQTAFSSYNSSSAISSMNGSSETYIGFPRQSVLIHCVGIPTDAAAGNFPFAE